MALKEILVHIDTSRHRARRLETAIALAKDHGAALGGLFVVTRARIPEYIRASLAPEILAAGQDGARAAAASAEEFFRQTVAGHGLETEWHRAEGDPSDTIALHGRYADLLVLGQRDPEEPVPEGMEEIPQRPILSTGRPVLLVPRDGGNAGKAATVGRRVAIAWDASRLATRAIADALPLLARAEAVHLLVVNPDGAAAGRGETLGAAIRHYLRRHGIEATARHIAGEPTEASRRLQEGAEAVDADLLVMGAYGHLRLRELVLGGVTAHMIRNARIPVLMSH